MIRAHVVTYDVPLEAHRIEVLIDMVVRLVLSHVCSRPVSRPRRPATVAWIAARVLAGLSRTTTAATPPAASIRWRHRGSVFRKDA